MALKIPKARLFDPSGVVAFVNADNYDKVVRPGRLLCMDARCDARVHHVCRHSVGDREVQAHFAKNPRQVHARVCKFDVAATVMRIAARSERFERARDPIDVGPGGTAEFRLNIMFDGLRDLRRIIIADQDVAGQHEGVETVAGVRTFTPYLRKAKAVLALLARLGDLAELRDAIRISYGGAKLAWHDFFYGPGELERLYERLRVLQVREKPFHPVAVVVCPKDVRHTLRDAVVNCRSGLVRAESGGGVRIIPRLACRPSHLSRSLADQRWSLVCAIPRPRLSELDQKPGPKETAFVDVYMDIVSRNQFAFWPH